MSCSAAALSCHLFVSHPIRSDDDYADVCHTSANNPIIVVHGSQGALDRPKDAKDKVKQVRRVLNYTSSLQYINIHGVVASSMRLGAAKKYQRRRRSPLPPLPWLSVIQLSLANTLWCRAAAFVLGKGAKQILLTMLVLPLHIHTPL